MCIGAKGGKPGAKDGAGDDAAAGDSGDLTTVRQRTVVPTSSHLYVQAPAATGCNVVVAVVRDPAAAETVSATADAYAVVAVRKDTAWGFFSNPSLGAEAADAEGQCASTPFV